MAASFLSCPAPLVVGRILVPGVFPDRHMHENQSHGCQVPIRLVNPTHATNGGRDPREAAGGRDQSIANCKVDSLPLLPVPTHAKRSMMVDDKEIEWYM